MAPLPQTAAAGNAAGLPTAREVFDELRRICPADTILVEETPSNLGDLHAAWPITQPDAFYTMASGGLGWSAPASVGIALAERDSGRNRPVVMVAGDGSFQYSVQSIWTAAQLARTRIRVPRGHGENHAAPGTCQEAEPQGPSAAMARASWVREVTPVFRNTFRRW